MGSPSYLGSPHPETQRKCVGSPSTWVLPTPRLRENLGGTNDDCPLGTWMTFEDRDLVLVVRRSHTHTVGGKVLEKDSLEQVRCRRDTPSTLLILTSGVLSLFQWSHVLPLGPELGSRRLESRSGDGEEGSGQSLRVGTEKTWKGLQKIEPE